MALPSPEELQKLAAELNDAAKAYSASPDLNGYMSRVHVLEKAKEITQSLISPDQMPNYHGRNVRKSANPVYFFSAVHLMHLSSNRWQKWSLSEHS
jgi:hypothetical protein